MSSSGTCSQNWLKSSCEKDDQPTYLTKLEKTKEKRGSKKTHG